MKKLSLIFILIFLQKVNSQEIYLFDKDSLNIDVVAKTNKSLLLFTEDDIIEVCNFKIGDTITLKAISDISYFYAEKDGCYGFISDFNFETNDFVKNAKKAYLNVSDSIQKVKTQTRKIEEQARIDNENKKYRAKCEYSVNEVDNFTGKKRKNIIFYDLANDLRIRLQKYGSARLVWFSTFINLGCASPYKNNQSEVKVKLENGKIFSFYHIGNIDCSGFTLVARITNTEYIELQKSKINVIRLNGTKHYMDFEDITYNTFFQDKLKCIK